jgi:hypothetical protein
VDEDAFAELPIAGSQSAFCMGAPSTAKPTSSSSPSAEVGAASKRVKPYRQETSRNRCTATNS